MTGDGHVPFRGSLGVEIPGATRLMRSTCAREGNTMELGGFNSAWLRDLVF